MADYTLTSSSVLKGANAITATGTAGESIAAGQPLYIDTSASNVLKLADANASLLTSTVAGVALHAAATGQPITYVTDDDDFTHGLATVASGAFVILSATSGGLCPSADLASGHYAQLVMVAKSASKAVLKLASSGTAKP